jgi:hypothetical protein
MEVPIATKEDISMSSVPQHRHHSWWAAALSPHSTNAIEDFDEEKPIVESLLRDLKVQGKLTPETIN